ncbi:MAG: N-acetylmuramoyl-L-alanine amidase [Gallionellaceae bacterium]|nr:N-acetylmuramoyl-L-alanine amidase [Gallionellaceae bacterium]
MARKIELIIIHCSDSPNGRTLFTGTPGEHGFVTPVQEIDRWHAQRGFKRQPQWRAKQNPDLTSIGYHFVIYTRGAVATGRHVDEVGAHCQGYNAASIGICLIGCDKFTRAQWDSLRDWLCGLAKTLEQQKPNPPKRFNNPTPAEARAIFAQLGVRVLGHRQLNPDKTCPNFNVYTWLESGMQPPVEQIYLDPIEGEIA